MSQLIAIAYHTPQTAEEVRAKLINLQAEHVIQLDDALVATRHEGKIKLRQRVSTTGAGAAAGVLWDGRQEAQCRPAGLAPIAEVASLSDVAEGRLRDALGDRAATA